MQTCPKCGYTRIEGDTVLAEQCPHCGIIYKKFRATCLRCNRIFAGSEISTPGKCPECGSRFGKAQKQSLNQPGAVGNQNREDKLNAATGVLYVVIFILVFILAEYIFKGRGASQNRDSYTTSGDSSHVAKAKEDLPEEALPYVSDLSRNLCIVWHRYSRALKRGAEGPPSPKWNPDAVLMELKRRHPKWDWARIEAWEIALDMRDDEVICAWGYPDSVHRSNIRGRETEQWEYRSQRHRYLYFEHRFLYGWN